MFFVCVYVSYMSINIRILYVWIKIEFKFGTAWIKKSKIKFLHTFLDETINVYSIMVLSLSVWEPHLCLCKHVGSQASRRVTRRLAWDPTCFLLSPSFPIKSKQNLKVFKSRQLYNLFLENYPAFKGLSELSEFHTLPI